MLALVETTLTMVFMVKVHCAHVTFCRSTDEGLPDVPAARKKKKPAAPRGSRQVCMSSAIVGLFKRMLSLVGQCTQPTLPILDDRL